MALTERGQKSNIEKIKKTQEKSMIAAESFCLGELPLSSVFSVCQMLEGAAEQVQNGWVKMERLSKILFYKCFFKCTVIHSFPEQ